MNEFKTIKEICDIVVDCPHSTPKWTSGGKIVIRNNNIKNGYIDLNNPSYTDEENFKKRIRRAIPQCGDVIITREAPMGEVGMIPENVECCLGQRMVLLRVNEKKCDRYYFLYRLQSRYVQHQISWSEGTGTTVSNLRIPHLEKIKIPYIPIEKQRKVASVIQCIEEKIEINKKINKNLEQQVSILYQSWFENFEITNGVCPESWFYQELSTIADIASGKRPPVKSDTCNEKTPIPIVGAASVMGFTSEANHSDKILVTGRVGTHGVIQRFNTPCWTSDNTLVITSPYYEFTNQILHKIDYSSMNRGSTQPLITQGDMKKVVVLVPDEDTLAKFEKFASSLMAKWNANNKENIKLASLRDTLLPKLMSGELDVFNIEL